MAELIENGWKYKSVDASQPLIFNVGTVSSLGIPHIHHFDFGYFFDIDANVTASLKTLILYGRGRGKFKSRPV